MFYTKFVIVVLLTGSCGLQVSKKVTKKKTPPLKVKKADFDRVLGKLIQTPPIQRNQSK
jgi:hypothetical protein